MRARVILATAAAVGLIAGLSACTSGSSGIGASRVGATIPAADRLVAGAVQSTELDGAPFDLSSDHGHVVVLNFWATWCDVCTTESPQLDQVYRETKASGVDFVGVDTKEVSRSAAVAFTSDNDITYPSIWDPKSRTAIDLGKLRVPQDGSLPYTILLDKQGRIAALWDGPITPADLRPVLEQLAAE
jgi:peroxiredoxin